MISYIQAEKPMSFVSILLFLALLLLNIIHSFSPKVFVQQKSAGKFLNFTHYSNTLNDTHQSQGPSYILVIISKMALYGVQIIWPIRNHLTKHPKCQEHSDFTHLNSTKKLLRQAVMIIGANRLQYKFGIFSSFHRTSHMRSIRDSGNDSFSPSFI